MRLLGETWQPLEQSSLPFLENKLLYVWSSQMESRLPTALLLVPAIFQPAQRACSPMYDRAGCPICSLNYLLPGVGVHLCNFPVYQSPLLGHRGTGPDPIAFLPFLLDYMCIFFIALVTHKSFCQFPVRIIPHVEVFLMFLLREVSFTSILLLCHLHQNHLATFESMTHLLT